MNTLAHEFNFYQRLTCLALERAVGRSQAGHVAACLFEWPTEEASFIFARTTDGEVLGDGAEIVRAVTYPRFEGAFCLDTAFQVTSISKEFLDTCSPERRASLEAFMQRAAERHGSPFLEGTRP